jgi:hypothetical protein
MMLGEAAVATDMSLAVAGRAVTAAHLAAARTARIALPAGAALAVLAGYGAAWLLGSLNARLERRGAARGALRQERMPRVFAVFGITALIGLAIAAEHLAVPLPTTDARVPEVYRRIAQEPGEGPEPKFMEYEPTTWPGARLPHTWLADGSAAAPNATAAAAEPFRSIRRETHS